MGSMGTGGTRALGNRDILGSAGDALNKADRFLTAGTPDIIVGVIRMVRLRFLSNDLKFVVCRRRLQMS